MNVQKSSSFLLPILDLNFHELTSNGFINTFVADAKWMDDLGSNILVLFNSESITSEFISKLRAHKLYKKDYQVDDGLMFVFDLSEWREKVVLPFLDGKYSQIDRDYVKKYFPEKIYQGGVLAQSVNYKILTKHEDLRYYWEAIIDTSLPEDAEVWSKPELTDEVFNYGTVEQVS